MIEKILLVLIREITLPRYLKYHLVLVTKYRRKCFTAQLLDGLEALCQELCSKWEINLEQFSGEADHVHLMLDMHPNIMPSKSINNLKTVTSRLIRKEFSRMYSKTSIFEENIISTVYLSGS